jgi:restriction endonuclease Mrr
MGTNNPVRSPDIQKFAGGSRSFPLAKGLFFTNSSYTENASKFVKEKRLNIILIDENKLIELMFKSGVGVASTATYEVRGSIGIISLIDVILLYS